MEFLEILLYAPYVKVNFLALRVEQPSIYNKPLGRCILLRDGEQCGIPFTVVLIAVVPRV